MMKEQNSLELQMIEELFLRTQRRNIGEGTSCDSPSPGNVSMYDAVECQIIG